MSHIHLAAGGPEAAIGPPYPGPRIDGTGLHAASSWAILSVFLPETEGFHQETWGKLGENLGTLGKTWGKFGKFGEPWRNWRRFKN